MDGRVGVREKCARGGRSRAEAEQPEAYREEMQPKSGAEEGKERSGGGHEESQKDGLKDPAGLGADVRGEGTGEAYFSAVRGTLSA